MDKQESIFQFSKHSENFHKPCNFKFYGIEIASEGLVVLPKMKIFKNFT